MRARWVFQLFLIEVVCRIYSDWMILLGQNRSFFQIAIKLQNSHFPRGRSTSTRRKIGNGSVADKPGVIALSQRTKDKNLVEACGKIVDVLPRSYASFLAAGWMYFGRVVG